MLFFFLSCARGSGDSDELAERFFHDLSEEVRSTAGEPRDAQVGFLERQAVPLAGQWSAQLRSALARCQTFLALCSPRYFASDQCGREWAVFERRLREYGLHAREEPPLLLPITWWHVGELPPLAARRQAVVASLESAYYRDGLRQLIRLRRHREIYRDTVSALAGHIVTQARAHPMQPTREECRFGEVPNAFLSYSTAKARSQFIHFVIWAGTRSSAQAAGRRHLHYYGERPVHWSPYRPEIEAHLGILATGVAEEDCFSAQVVDISDLQERLRSALEHNQIVVLLVDAWVSRISSERDRLLVWDASGDWDSVACVLLLPADQADRETQANWPHLKDELSRILPSRFTSGDARRSGLRPVETMIAFEADLRAMLQVAQNQAFRCGTVYGQVPDAEASRRPVLTLPVVQEQPVETDQGFEAQP